MAAFVCRSPLPTSARPAFCHSLFVDSNTILCRRPSSQESVASPFPPSLFVNPRKRRLSDAVDDQVHTDCAAIHDAAGPRYQLTHATTVVTPAAKHRITHFSEDQVEREAMAYLACVGRRSGRAHIFET